MKSEFRTPKSEQVPPRRAFNAAMWLSMAAAAALAAGCVSASKADARARMAYMQGQQQAMMQLQQMQSRGPSVHFIGPVQNPQVRWQEGLTLTEAIVSANYLNSGDPSVIIIHRNGEGIPVDPKKLLSGEEVPLQSGDIVQIQP